MTERPHGGHQSDQSHQSHPSQGSAPGGGQGGGFDSEIDIRRILEVGAWLAGATIAAIVIGFFLYRALGSMADRADPAPSPLPEANQPVEPPAPRLQVNPERELQSLLASSGERLSSWGWVDQSAGRAHMPIDEAIARLAVPDSTLAPAPAVTAPNLQTAPEAPAAHPITAPAESGH